MKYLRLVAIVLGVNLLPAFGPPTWSVLVALGLHERYTPWALVVLGALSAASGRALLALACRALHGRLSPRRAASLAAARAALTGNRWGSLAGLALFTLSPLPSAQLFEAAGFMGIPLPPVIGVFFVGRLVSYSAYVAGVSALRGSALGHLVAGSLTGAWGIAVQVAFLGALVALMRIDWVTVLQRRSPRHATPV